MENNKIAISMEQQFGEVIDIILQHKSRASRAVNNELLFTAWHVGRYVSAKLKSEEWGKQGCIAAIRIYPYPTTGYQGL